ncbi:MAG: pyruvate dehydrogenase (acetyl-transferring) E1 component subunit alpha [Firmicutes bacterium]|nr:pyruvate dehydrogenase (acetyl-transferring) E1 component subunit alpha [Bacillota bacterium]
MRSAGFARAVTKPTRWKEAPTVELLRVIDGEGRPLREAPCTDEDARALLERMIFLRAFDERAVALQRQGRIGTYAPYRGMEACQAGAASALSPEDWLLPTYRDHGAAMIHGLPVEEALAYWAGRVESYRAPAEVNVFPPAVPIATQIPHAAGIGWGLRRAGSAAAVLCFFGDGATSEGDFHEGINFAGVFRAPVVFFCQNNGYAISVPFSRQTAAASIAVRAAGYGIAGERVDGNDALAVLDAVRRALQRAREGGGPTLIEALTYRVGPHTTSDDPSRYRDPEEAQRLALGDPLERLRRYLAGRGAWDEADEARAQEAARARVAAAVRAVEAMAPPDPADIFAHVYGAEPLFFQEQRRRFLAELESAARPGAGGPAARGPAPGGAAGGPAVRTEGGGR